jgi:peptide/nickel transport system substrate-binding protein
MARNNYWSQFGRQRMSRRRLLGAAGVGAAGLTIAAACGGDDGGDEPSETPGGSSGEPVAGGRYKEATSVISDATFGLDPHLAIAAGLAYFARMYNVLINRSAVDPDYYLYDLAADEGLEQQDELTYIFTLRPGVMIPENTLGVPSRAMDAEDAVVTFNRIQGLELANACQFVCQYFTRHEAVDSMTYRVESAVPYAWFLYNIGRAISTIPPRELIQQEDGAKMRSSGVGGGPFYISAFTEGQSVNLEKNPLYYKPGRPYMDGWDVVIIPDRPALRSAFQSQASYQYGAASDAEVQELEGSLDVYKASDDPTYTFIAFSMNVTQPPFDNPDIRKAAMHAINRQEYIDIVYQGAAQANGIVHWPVSGALPPEELDELQGFNPEMSRQLIQQATGQDTVDINMMFPNSPIQEHEQHLPIFLEQMRAAGFNIQQEARDLGGWLADYRGKNYQCSLALNQIYETAEIPLDFQHSKGPAGSDIYAAGLQDPAIDEIIDATKSITDFDAQVAAIQEAQRTIYEAGPSFLPLVTPFSRTLYWNFVKDVPTGLGSTGLFLTDGMWLDL